MFVLAGSGAGIPVYRRLQRENIPFATGILYTNDLDYRLARLLAAQVISVEAFTSVGEETVSRAAEVMSSCERILLAGDPAGTPNETLAELAAKSGKLEIVK